MLFYKPFLLQSPPGLPEVVFLFHTKGRVGVTLSISEDGTTHSVGLLWGGEDSGLAHPTTWQIFEEYNEWVTQIGDFISRIIIWGT